MTDRKLVNFEVEGQTYEIAKDKLDHGELSEELRTRIHEIAHGTTVTNIERKRDLLTEKRKENRELQQQIRNLQNEYEENERDIERLEAELDQLLDQTGEYQGFLKALSEDLTDGKHLFVGHKQVEKAAELGDVTQQEVLDVLQERNPDVDESQFYTAKG